MTDRPTVLVTGGAGYIGSHACRALAAAGYQPVVYGNLSTGAVYGNADSKELPEDFPCAPINPYGASKWMIERMLADYRAAYGFGAFCLRYFNASGADPAGGIGELRDNETHLIPRAMMALQGHVDFAVFGDDYDTPDGTPIRDYIHVTDLAAKHVAGRAPERLKRLSQPASANVPTAACCLYRRQWKRHVWLSQQREPILHSEGHDLIRASACFQARPKEHGANASGRKPAIRARD